MIRKSATETIGPAPTRWERVRLASGGTFDMLGEWRPSDTMFCQDYQVRSLNMNDAHGFSSEDVSFLEQLPTLEHLQIVVQRVKPLDLTPVNALHNLRSISITFDYKGVIDFGNFPNLEFVYLGEPRKGYETLFNCTGLRLCRIDKYTYESLQPLANLAALESLHLNNSSKLQSLAGLAALSKLEYVELSLLRQLSSLEGVQALQRLIFLIVDTCKKVNNLSPVAALTGLQHLTILNCGDIATLAPLPALSQLRSFNFAQSTRIVDGDLSPLLRLPQLKGVIFENRQHYSHTLAKFPRWQAIFPEVAETMAAYR